MNACAKIITHEELSKMKEKFYTSGREIKVGDKLIFGLIKDDDPENIISVKTIALHPDEFGTVYEQDETMTKSQFGIDLPILKKIK
jgi:hypothetical protein